MVINTVIMPDGDSGSYTISSPVHPNYNVLIKNKIRRLMRSIVIGFSFSLFRIATSSWKMFLRQRKAVSLHKKS